MVAILKKTEEIRQKSPKMAAESIEKPMEDEKILVQL